MSFIKAIRYKTWGNYAKSLFWLFDVRNWKLIVWKYEGRTDHMVSDMTVWLKLY